MMNTKTKTGRMIFTIGILCGAILLIGVPLVILITVFGSPFSPFGVKVEIYQTLIGGSFAAIAAVITAGAIFFSASLPIKEEHKRMAIEREEKRRIGAAVIASQLQGVVSQIALLENDLGPGVGLPVAVQMKPVELPDQLQSFEIISTQNASEAKQLASFLAEVSHINAISKKQILNSKIKSELRSQLGEIKDLGFMLIENSARVAEIPLPELEDD